VPFIQISDEKHKKKLSTPPPGATLRVYYASPATCKSAYHELSGVMAQMVAEVRVDMAMAVGVARRGVAWRGVAWRGVAWRDVDGR
jgi:hypothetical protein